MQLFGVSRTASATLHNDLKLRPHPRLSSVSQSSSRSPELSPRAALSASSLAVRSAPRRIVLFRARRQVRPLAHTPNHTEFNRCFSPPVAPARHLVHTFRAPSCRWYRYPVRQRRPGHVPARPALGPPKARYRQAHRAHCVRRLLRRVLRHPATQILHREAEADVPDPRRDCCHDPCATQQPKRRRRRAEEVALTPDRVCSCLRVEGGQWVCTRCCE